MKDALKYSAAFLFMVLCLYPALFFLTFLILLISFIFSELISTRLKRLISTQSISCQNKLYDPLFNTPNSNLLNSFRRKEKETPPVLSSKEKNDLKVDDRINNSISKFFLAVFNYYVHPTWAPYETRKQLRVSFTKILNSFGERVQKVLFSKDETGNTFQLRKSVLKKIAPLVINYLQQARCGRIVKLEEEKEAYVTLRQLVKFLLKRHLSPEDAKCALWQELCISLLSDAVLWNLIQLGKREIPPLVNTQIASYIYLHSSQYNTVEKHKTIEKKDSNNTKEIYKSVPFLLETFLDPKNDVEQPSLIISRWRPSLDYILTESERNLLYCLIQYLKEHRALEYLQAILDESPDGSSYCRKILEMQYLAPFCRSRIFLENLGFSRVEVACEVDPELLLQVKSDNSKSSTHMRSASYGGGSSGGLWDQNVVDGFAIYPKVPLQHSSSSSEAYNSYEPPGGGSESDSLFRRRHVLEPFILKFYTSLMRPKRDVSDILSSVTPPRVRLGTEGRLYPTEFYTKLLPQSNIDISLFRELSELVISCIDKNRWMKPILSGWISVISPLFETKFEKILYEEIENLLTVNRFVELMDILTQIFSPVPKEDLKSEDFLQREASATTTRKILYWTLQNLFLLEKLGENLNNSSGLLVLFFVDILDLFVSELEISYT